MKRKRNLKVGDGLSPSAVRERWTRRAACMAGLAAMAGSARRHARGGSGRGTPGLGGGYHRRCSSNAQFRLTRFSGPFFLVSILAAAWALAPFGDSGLVGPSRGPPAERTRSLEGTAFTAPICRQSPGFPGFDHCTSGAQYGRSNVNQGPQADLSLPISVSGVSQE